MSDPLFPRPEAIEAIRARQKVNYQGFASVTQRFLVAVDDIDTLLAALDQREAIVTELARVVAMSLEPSKGGQQVGPMFPGRMAPSMARHFEKLLAASTAAQEMKL